MKRDMEFVRKLLLDFSNGEGRTNFNSRIEEDQIYMYHLKIMREAGLVDYKESGYKGGMMLLGVPTLTWFGNDYLDTVANDSVWSRTKDGLKEKGFELSGVPFNVLKEYAVLQLKQFIGME
ncbi:DUF2513 domain-containing protein [Cytobacillus oceanisediminis]|uniref:DUF2513 domain-containing protein n=1 Tax=Cytobacillus oceanisediminis TaxID=665099 RepID=UPI00207AB500|nr:DUF2513 domain-containing protein [Cytobacillus oceanisediminis]USK46336.1 DUF2513 domain-containing protein [Cytobacillus oceanisediminis]